MQCFLYHSVVLLPDLQLFLLLLSLGLGLNAEARLCTSLWGKEA